MLLISFWNETALAALIGICRRDQVIWISIYCMFGSHGPLKTNLSMYSLDYCDVMHHILVQPQIDILIVSYTSSTIRCWCTVKLLLTKKEINMIIGSDFEANFQPDDSRPLVNFLLETFNLRMITHPNTLSTKMGTTILCSSYNWLDESDDLCVCK